MGNVLSAFDPTTGRGLANIATGGMYELTKRTTPAVNPLAAAVGGKLDTSQPSVNGAAPTPYYAARYDPKTRMPKYSRQPGDVSGYALNAHQQALVDALKRDGGPAQPATTGIPRGDPSPGVDTPPAPPPPAAAQPPVSPLPGGAQPPAPGWSPLPGAQRTPPAPAPTPGQQPSQNSFLALMQALRSR